MRKRGELVFDELIPWLIAIGVLVILLVLYKLFWDKGSSALDFFKNMWRFGR